MHRAIVSSLDVANHAAFVLALTATLSCQGVIDNPRAGPSGGRPETSEVSPSASGLRRLTRVEYQNAMEALFGADVQAAVNDVLRRLPDDVDQNDGFSTYARGVTDQHVRIYFEVAEAVAEQVVANEAWRSQVGSCLGGPEVDSTCVESAVRQFGRRVYRRPLEEPEVAALVELYESALEDGQDIALESVILALLMSPSFLYKVELGEPEQDGDVVELTDYELAARLSFAAWGAPPDEELLAIAEAEQLHENTVFRQQAERLFADPRSESWIFGFFTEYLGIDRLAVPSDDTFLEDIQRDGLLDAMREELRRFLASVIFEQDGTFDDLLTSSQAFVAHPGLAEVYGIPPASDESTVQSFADPRRSGLLTRAGLLSGSGRQTAPIRRGAHILRNWLCVELTPPTPDELPEGEEVTPPEFNPDQTAREAWTERTDSSACRGCHAIINPLGFAFEEFDALGRFRRTEEIIAPDGNIVNELPIDVRVEVLIDDARPIPIDGAASLSQALAESRTARRCFGTQWLRFVHGRDEIAADEPLLDSMETASAVQPLRDVMLELVTSPSFRELRIP